MKNSWVSKLDPPYFRDLYFSALKIYKDIVIYIYSLIGLMPVFTGLELRQAYFFAFPFSLQGVKKVSDCAL